MLIQPLLDKLIQLRLPAFRDGLQEQLNNPQYAELAFEERLALLVDQECTNRHQRRIQRRIKLANFPQPACHRRPRPVPRPGSRPPFHPRTGSIHLDCQPSQHPGPRTHRVWENFSRFGSGFICLPQRLFGALLSHLTPALPTGPSPTRMAPIPALLASLAKLDLLILDDWMRDPIYRPECPGFARSPG